ncbi:sensor histidine kinase [Aquimarina sp. 2201CG5-10]|uniref:sensor histidine kinase n=1 Tax=Aquimarina callyspongiae TaxID=3098150 RepID=UPI002AB42425|nr:histidine kinase [Aquimarina sp. 2201CG5-10]MDY8135987.1 histidine kinase [Aquimarina sp. 2201CG5-10]
MPKFLFKKRIVPFTLLLITSIIITTIFTSYYLSFYFKSIDVHLPTSIFFVSIAGKIAIITEIILSLCLSMTLFLTDAWYKKERSLKEIEQKQLETELNLLKNQINPHFLFNSLNSIYIMLGKNLESGKNMLLQFSEILSHQLYETSKKNIELYREFDNLKNYIAIEKIRHGDLVIVECSFPKYKEELTITPMILLPLVENAFKHGQSSTGYKIKIIASIEFNHVLNFKVENTVSNKHIQNSSEKGKGIGLTNVKKRLALIYPNKHLLHIESKNAKFIVNLKIQLNENEMLNS